MGRIRYGEKEKAIHSAIGHRFAGELERHNMKQEKFLDQLTEWLGDACPTDVRTVDRWKKGECAIPPYVLYVLHEKWGVDLNWLIGGDDI